jgi:hypothetical protein
MLDTVILSLDLIMGCQSCQKIIVCDGYVVSPIEAHKSGKIDVTTESHYKGYLEAIQFKVAEGTYSNTMVVIQSERYGFAQNVKMMLDLVKTRYVMILQHDQCFVRSVNAIGAINVMNSHSDINYIGFIASSEQTYESILKSQFKNFYEDLLTDSNQYFKRQGYSVYTAVKAAFPLHAASPLLITNIARYKLPLLPLVFWYDKPHIGRTDYYKNYVFGIEHVDYSSGKSSFVTNFIEDSFGQIQRNNIKRQGVAAFNNYGSYILYDDPSRVATVHLNGRGFLNEEQRETLNK